MFSERLKQLRKEKGLSQQELADILCVVRQTISKWEKGLSLPDAEMLVKLAEALGVSVNELLGIDVENTAAQQEIIKQLMKINEQLVIKNRRSRRIWKIVAVIFGVFIAVNVVIPLLAAVLFMTNHAVLGDSGGAGAVEVTETAEEVIWSAPTLLLRDAMSEKPVKTELPARAYNWSYREGRSGGNSASQTDHPLTMDKELLGCVQIQGDFVQREYHISFPDYQNADEITVCGWNISDLGNENADPQIYLQESPDMLLELQRDMVYKITAVWKEGKDRTYFGTTTYMFYTE